MIFAYVVGRSDRRTVNLVSSKPKRKDETRSGNKKGGKTLRIFYHFMEKRYKIIKLSYEQKLNNKGNDIEKHELFCKIIKETI